MARIGIPRFSAIFSMGTSDKACCTGAPGAFAQPRRAAGRARRGPAEHSLVLDQVQSAVAPRVAPHDAPHGEHHSPRHARTRRIASPACASTRARTGSGIGEPRRDETLVQHYRCHDQGTCARHQLARRPRPSRLLHATHRRSSALPSLSARDPAAPRPPRVDPPSRSLGWRRLDPAEPVALRHLASGWTSHHDQVMSRKQSRLRMCKRFPQQPLDLVALDCAADPARDREPQPRPLAELVRKGVEHQMSVGDRTAVTVDTRSNSALRESLARRPRSRAPLTVAEREPGCVPSTRLRPDSRLRPLLRRRLRLCVQRASPCAHGSRARVRACASWAGRSASSPVKYRPVAAPDRAR